MLVQLHYRPGDFVIHGNPLFTVFPGERAEQDQLASLQETVRFGHHRTLIQDMEFAFQQLVEIALRALSPGINDPFTAMSCIEELGLGLAFVASRGDQPRIWRDNDGTPRVLIKRVGFEGVADVAFNQIRQNGAQHPAVMIRMLDTIAAVAQGVSHAPYRAVLLRHATEIHAAATTAAREPVDLADIEARFHRAAQLWVAPPKPNAETGPPALFSREAAPRHGYIRRWAASSPLPYGGRSARRIPFHAMQWTLDCRQGSRAGMPPPGYAGHTDQATSQQPCRCGNRGGNRCFCIIVADTGIIE